MSVDQLPPFEDYNMDGRTYRYFKGDPLYPFGHGLRYTQFSYSDLKVPATVTPDENIPVSVIVKNIGERASDEVVQLYLTDSEASVPVPIRALKAFHRLHLKQGQGKKVSFLLSPRQLSLIDDDGNRVLEPGLFEISVGGKQPGFSGNADASTTEVIKGTFEVIGNKRYFEH